MPETGFQAHLREALALLSREHPESYDRVCRTLAGRAVVIVVDGAACRVRADNGRLQLASGGGEAQVAVATTAEAIVSVLDGRERLDEAVLGERVRLRGAVDDLLAFLDGLTWFLRGAVRSPGFAPLLRRFRSHATHAARDAAGGDTDV